MPKICYIVTVPITIRAFFIPQLQYLSKNGFDVSVICSPDNSLQKDLGATVRYIPLSIPRGVSILGSLRVIKKLISLFKKEKFDLIQYSTPNAGICASIAGKISRVPIRNYHIMGFRYFGATGIKRFVLKSLEKLTCGMSTSIECVSKSNLEIGEKEGLFVKEMATVIWNGSTGGVDLGRFNYNKRTLYREEIRSMYGIEKNAFVFGFVGRITKDKGIDEILEAFSAITGAYLLMVGATEDVALLNQSRYVASLSNAKIKYIGLVEDVERYYAAMDVLLLPSYREGFGNVVIEAAAMGTPAIVSRIPGPVDTIVEGKTAIAVSAKNVTQLVYGMNKMMHSNYVQMGDDAATYVASHFNSEKLNEYILERKIKLLEV